MYHTSTFLRESRDSCGEIDDSLVKEMTTFEADEKAMLAKKKRKEEGRLKKKRRIEDGGGVRPRSNSKDGSPEKSKPNRTGRRGEQSSKGKSMLHRFGKVMETLPGIDGPRSSTWSIAVPGSVVANCQTKELRTQLVGQIARAATIYHVDEIVVFDDKLAKESSGRQYRKRRDNEHRNNSNSQDKDEEKADSKSPDNDDKPRHKFDPHDFMARLLQYCECPQYMRRVFFPMHPDLQFAGLLAPVDAPHHVRAEDHCKFREGVVMEKQGPGGGSLVNCGIRGRPVEIQTKIQPGIRCTVKLDTAIYKKPGQIKGEVVAPSAPREEDGTDWGYQVRSASSLKEVLNNCPFEGGYDLKVGTSERGERNIDDSNFSIPSFKHAIIVFGGVAGIEESVDADESLRLPGSESRKLFDMVSFETTPFPRERIREDPNPDFVFSGSIFASIKEAGPFEQRKLF